MTEKNLIKDENLEDVVGGLFHWNGYENTMTYTHQDGSVTMHNVLNMSAAWKLSNELHAQYVPEDQILARLIQAGYVEG